MSGPHHISSPAGSPQSFECLFVCLLSSSQAADDVEAPALRCLRRIASFSSGLWLPFCTRAWNTPIHTNQLRAAPSNNSKSVLTALLRYASEDGVCSAPSPSYWVPNHSSGAVSGSFSILSGCPEFQSSTFVCVDWGWLDANS